MQKGQIENNEYQEYKGPSSIYQYEAELKKKNKFDILNKMFKRTGPRKMRLVKSPENRRFPLENPALLQKWILATKRKGFTPNKHTRLCSKPFNLEDFLKEWPDSQRKNLKFDDVPTLFDFLLTQPLKSSRVLQLSARSRTQRIKGVSPKRPKEKVIMVGGNTAVFPRLEEEVESRKPTEDRYSMVYYGKPLVSDEYSQEKQYIENCGEPSVFKGREILLGNVSKNKSYFEVVKVEDRGTDPCDLELPKSKEDKHTEPMIPANSQIFNWAEQRDQLRKDLQDKDEVIKHTLEEGKLLLEDIERVKNHLLANGKLSEVISAQILIKQETPGDFLHLSRICLIELWKEFLIAQKQSEVDLEKLKQDLNNEKKETSQKEDKLKILERKLEGLSIKANKGNQDIRQLEAKIKILESSIESGKKMMKDAEKFNKVKVGKLEGELLLQKQANTQLTKDLEEKDQMSSQLKNSIERLKTNLESSKQHVKDIQSSYKSKVVKLEAELSSKMAALCENQTLVNKQLSQALDQSSSYVNQIQEIKKENFTLQALNKSISEKMTNMEREMGKALERCGVAERKLSRETKEVTSLRKQLDKLEGLQEEELLSVDGDTWCQIMYQQDQWILKDLQSNLQEKERNIEVLRAQGDCPLKEFEKIQKELQQRRQQFNELRDVFLGFEKKRDNLVREQREFYSKMVLLSKKTISRDRFFKNLIEECQSKTERLEELEKKVMNTDNIIEEANKISEAQLKAMQMEMKYTAEKLYEFENQIRMKEMQLQEVIRVFEQEKKNKTTAEEAMHTYKILLEDSKKENSEIRSKLNYLEDLEKNRINVLKVTEELSHETQKRQDTESKLKKLEKDFLDMKKQITSKEDISLKSDNDAATKNSNYVREIEQLKRKVQETTENKKYVERILMESQRSKELLQKDHEELCIKMRRAVRVMVEAKETQENLELKLDQRMHVIHQLQKSQAETEDQLDSLKAVLHEMKETIDLLHQDREDLKTKLKNHIHCKAERTLQQELKMLQRDKSVAEEQNAREKEMLLHRLRDNEHTIKEQHKHLRAFQEQLDNLNAQLREATAQLATERHNHTQQLLTLQADKKKCELYTEELQRKLTSKTKPQLTYEIVPSDTPHSSPFTTSDSYDPPIRDHNKHYYRK